MKARAWLEVKHDHLIHNLNLLKEMAGPAKIMAVAKDNCYGLGQEAIRLLEDEGVDFMAVSTLEEAIQLRHLPFSGNILILGYVHPDGYEDLIRYDLISSLYSKEVLDQFQAFGKPLRVHVKVNTGMNRLGFLASDFKTIADLYRNPHVRVEGIYSHLLSSDQEGDRARDIALGQIDAFNRVLAYLKDQNIDPHTRHLLASSGIEHYGMMAIYDYVRPGIYLTCGPRPFLNAASLKCRIAMIHDLEPHDHIGYGMESEITKPSKIATITIGYGDGLSRSLAKSGYCVSVKGVDCPFVGKMCMDYSFIDVSSVPDITLNDEVEIFGDHHSLEDLAKALDTIPNEVMTHLNIRLDKELV